jgi:hypothetical protein
VQRHRRRRSARARPPRPRGWSIEAAFSKSPGPLGEAGHRREGAGVLGLTVEHALVELDGAVDVVEPLLVQLADAHQGR